MSEYSITRLGVCPFGCNAGVDDGKVEFHWLEQEQRANGEVVSIDYYATCACCGVAFNTTWETDTLTISEIGYVRKNLESRLKLEAHE